MKYVAARVAGMSVVASIALLLLTTVAVYADDERPGDNGHHYGKTGNPGHHYGQLKHQEAPAPSTQTPPPSATQTQTPPPATTPARVGHASGNSVASDPAPTTNAGAADPPATVPVSNLQPAHVIAKPAPPSPAVSWMILLILPALLVVWLVVFARAALTAVRRWSATPAA